MSRSLCASAAAFAVIVGSTQAATILTFADPAQGPDTPLFTFAGNMLTGGWNSNGLTLETPGLSAPDFANARMEFDAVPIVPSGSPPFYNINGPGQIRFKDSGGNLLFTIDYSGGLLTDGLGFGSSTFAGYNVVFGGPMMEGNPTNEAFAFSFANQIGAPEDYTATASFTSSADNVPAPATLSLLGMGMLLAARRKR